MTKIKTGICKNIPIVRRPHPKKPGRIIHVYVKCKFETNDTSLDKCPECGDMLVWSVKEVKK